MSDVGRSVKEGAIGGLIAGVIFAIAYILASLIAGDAAIIPFRRLASVLLGTDALTTTSPPTVVVIALIAHLYLSTMFGLFYGVYNSALTMRTRSSPRRQAVVGMIYGVMLWLINYNVFARYRYPWLLALPQAPQVLLHALFYGLPLGLLYATAERRATALESQRRTHHRLGPTAHPPGHR